MTDADQDEINLLVDSGFFNEIMKSYFIKAMEQSELDHRTIENVCDNFKELLETTPAKEIIKER